MTTRPSYIVHNVEEKDVTVDWFFGRGRAGVKLRQGLLLLVAWFFAILPIVVTASALLHRDDPNAGWWNYEEGFELWDRTIAYLAIIVAILIVFFLVFHLLHRSTLKKRNAIHTYDAERLARRLEVADAWYSDKYGPEQLRQEQRRIQIEPYADIETYELRGLYESNGAN